MEYTDRAGVRGAALCEVGQPQWIWGLRIELTLHEAAMNLRT